MSVPHDLSPIEALDLLTRRIRPQAPESFPVDEAPSGYLAEDVKVHLQEPPGSPRQSLQNGYALPQGLREGDTCRLLGTVSAVGEMLDSTGQPIQASPTEAPSDGTPPPPSVGNGGSQDGIPPSVWRVETGAPLPPETVLVLPVDQAVLTGPDLLRIEKMPSLGFGIGEPGAGKPGKATSGSSGTVVRFRAGTFLDGRLRALLEVGGPSQIRVRPRFAVAFATIGDELTDPSARKGAIPGESSAAVSDLLGMAFQDRIRELQLTPQALGILEDNPESLRNVAFVAKERRAEVLLLAGGLGDGVTDRTLESLLRMDADVVLHARVFGPSSTFLFARLFGYDVLVLSGRPFVAAAQLDLLVTPALRAKLGASSASWDWSWARWPTTGAGSSAEGSLDRSTEHSSWRVLPGALKAAASGGPELETWQLPTRSQTRVPGQTGWAVLPPPGAESPLEKQQAYFQPFSTGWHDFVSP